jgi:hypothetical protein
MGFSKKNVINTEIQSLFLLIQNYKVDGLKISIKIHKIGLPKKKIKTKILNQPISTKYIKNDAKLSITNN